MPEYGIQTIISMILTWPVKKRHLSIHSLYHGFIVTVMVFEELHKLLRSDVVREWPQALTGAAG
jgi:multisubunit Na+/H+ antiporter MnhE subunit